MCWCTLAFTGTHMHHASHCSLLQVLSDEGDNAGFAQRATFITDPDGVLRWKVRQSADWRLAFLMAALQATPHQIEAGSFVGRSQSVC